MILKELLQPVQSVSKKFGGFAFGEDIFKEVELTPHEEMSQALDIFETRPLVNSGVRQLARFIIGGDISVETDDKWSKDFLNKWINMRPLLRIELENGIIQGLCTGNVYTEEVANDFSGKKIFDGIDIFPDSSKVYINLYDNDNIKNYYLIHVPTTVHKFMGQVPKRRRIIYFHGDNIFKKSIWCVTFNEKKFHHLRLGFSRNAIYGRSYISSIIDDANILKEILKNIAIISRYRALNSKILMPGDEQEEILEDDIEYAKGQFENIRDGSHIFLNKKLKIESFTNSNEYDTMSQEIDFLRKEISCGLVPNFITPFNSEVNRATAGEAKIPFQMEVEYLQNIFEVYYSKIIVNALRKSYKKLDKNTKIKFGNIDMESRESKVQSYERMFSSGGCTLNEYRKAGGLSEVKNGNKYSWQMKAGEDSALALMNRVSVKR